MSQTPPADLPQAMGPTAAAKADASVLISSQLLIAAVIFLFMVVVFILFLYLYAKHYMGPNPALRRSRAQFIFAAADRGPAASRGLAEEVLKALPIKIYDSAQFKEGLECAVCLSELSDGEEARILPKCGHGFHVQCIDMWFHSHSTCPLCRAPVTGEAEAVEAQPTMAEESPVFPTNVLFWGNQDQVSNRVSSQEGCSGSSSGPKKPEGMLVIDIPRRGLDDIVSPLPTSRFAGEEMKSPMEEARTPGSARLRSLRRLLSRGKMVIGGGACSPRGGDIEQGMGLGVAGEGSSLTPKTPTAK